MFVPGTNGAFGGEDILGKTGRDTEERSQGAVSPQEVVTNLVDLEPSEDNQNSENSGIVATFNQTSHARSD